MYVCKNSNTLQKAESRCMSKRCKIEVKLHWTTLGKSYILCRSAWFSFSMTLNHVEGHLSCSKPFAFSIIEYSCYDLVQFHKSVSLHCRFFFSGLCSLHINDSDRIPCAR